MQQATQQLTETFIAGKVTLVTGAAGAAAAVTPTHKMASVAGDWLVTNGVGVLSYAEIIQVIGATWVLLLICDRAIAGVRALLGRPKK